MKRTIRLDDFIQAFRDYDRDYYSLEAYEALFDFHEQLEADCGVEEELDVIAIRGDWTEYNNDQLVFDYGYILDADLWLADHVESEALEQSYSFKALKADYIVDLINELQNRTFVIKLSNSYLVQAF